MKPTKKILLLCLIPMALFSCKNSDSTVKIPIEIIDIHYNYNRGYASGKFMVDGSDIYVLDQFNKRHELKRNKETNQIETNFYDETDEPLAVSIKGYERILPIDKFFNNDSIFFWWDTNKGNDSFLNTVVTDVWKNNRLNNMTTNKIEKVSGQMMQEDFPNTASNYKIFKDSDGKEYYSCIDHRNKSNGMIVDSNFNFVEYDSAKSYDCYVVKDYSLALFLMEK